MSGGILYHVIWWNVVFWVRRRDGGVPVLGQQDVALL
jgi:hypothetical protein